MLVSCLIADTAADDGLKTLRILKIDRETNTALFVPTRAVISGPGLATAPIKLLIGDNLLVQGMISLREDPAELAELTGRIKRKYGQEFVIKKDMTTTVSMKVSNQEKPLWEHEIFSGNPGMPFQVTIDNNASASLKINLQFKPGGTQMKGKRHTVTIGHSRIKQTTNNQTSGTETLTASYTASESSTPGSFAVEQNITLHSAD
jgi:hypothetical protein